MQLLQSPAWNKGTAFTMEERTKLGLHGLLPPQVETIDEQVLRAYSAYLSKRTPLGRHIQLRALQDTNEILFYRLLLAHIEEMMPVVYTPVVADVLDRPSFVHGLMNYLIQERTRWWEAYSAHFGTTERSAGIMDHFTLETQAGEIVAAS